MIQRKGSELHQHLKQNRLNTVLIRVGRATWDKSIVYARGVREAAFMANGVVLSLFQPTFQATPKAPFRNLTG